NQNGIGAPLTGNKTTAREAVERDADGCALHRADDDETSTPGRGGERGGEDPGILIVPREHPERLGTRRLERASIGKQLTDIPGEPEFGPDLHGKPMLATAYHRAMPRPQAPPVQIARRRAVDSAAD